MVHIHSVLYSNKEIKDGSAYLIYLAVDDETVLKRINQRGEDYDDKMNIKSSISLETFGNFKTQLEEPRENERGFELTSDEKLLSQVDRVIEKVR